MSNQSNLMLSRRILAAKTIKSTNERKSKCSCLVLSFSISINYFLLHRTFIRAILNSSVANKSRAEGIFYLEYHALRLTIGNVPISTGNHDFNATYDEDIFKRLIESDWP